MKKNDGMAQAWLAFWVYFISYLWLGPILVANIHLWSQQFVLNAPHSFWSWILPIEFNPNVFSMIFANLLLYFFLTLFFVALFRKLLYRDLKSLLTSPRFAIRGVLFGLSIIIMFSFIGSIGAFVIQQQSIFPENQQLINLMFAQNFGATALLTLLFAPFVEELIFRLVLFRLGHNFHLQPWTLVVLSTLSYACIHLIAGEQLIVIVPYVAIGFALALTYQRYHNFWICFCIHSANNLLALLIAIFFQFPTN
ncbi:MAG: lysostaphin resistance A-like protein [Culicoidibacterales bacterium]